MKLHFLRCIRIQKGHQSYQFFYYILYKLNMEQPQHSHDLQSEESENIDLDDSANMNQDERALFLDIRKSRSNDSFLGRLIGTTQEIQKRPLVLDMAELYPLKTNNQTNQNIQNPVQTNMSIFKKVKKLKKHNKCDYQKNICGYIAKKIIRQFIGPSFDEYVENLCKKYYCSSDEARKFYLSKIQFVTGPSHIPSLLKPQKGDTQEIICGKFAFRQFFDWFLKERYLRYLILEGKMTDKKAYIEFKNNVLFNFLQQDQQQIDELVQTLINQKTQEHKIEEQMVQIRSFSNNSRRSRSSRDRNIILTPRQE